MRGAAAVGGLRTRLLLGLAWWAVACAPPDERAPVATAVPPAPAARAPLAGPLAAPAPAAAQDATGGSPPSPDRPHLVVREAADARRVWTGWRFAHLGFAVAAGGRFDADDLPDLALGGFTPGTDEARVLVQPGHAGDGTRDPLLDLRYVPATEWGPSLAFVGDVDGGGRDDLLVGAPCYSDDPDAPQKGAALLYLGERHAEGGTLDALDADLVLVGDARHARLGWSVAGVGDVDGDGYGDVAIGAPGCDDDPSDADAPACARQAGAVVLVRGGPDGLGAWIGDGRPRVVGATLTGEAPGDHFGWALVGLGDLDGDGGAEFAVGACQARRTSAFAFGRTGGRGWVGVYGLRSPSSAPSRRAVVRPPGPDPAPASDPWMYGAALAAAFAPPGGGATLLAVGAPQLERPGLGAVGGVFVYDARALSGGAPEAGDGGDPEAPDGALVAETRAMAGPLVFTDGMLGWSLAATHGSDGPLIIAGAPRAGRVDGRAIVFSLPDARTASTDGVQRPVTLVPRALLLGEPDSDKGRFGWSVAVGDLDGDGRVDALVGANGISVRVGEHEGLENGRAYLVSDVVPRP